MGQPNAALQALHDVITSKRHRTWQKVLETIMFKYVELCIQLKKGRLAKDGLIQYRIVCQQVNVNSLEEVIKHFLKLATEKAEQAQAQAAASAKASTLEIDDLEAENTPENLMLKSVSVENDKDRADRELVTPWFKFLWETYRSILEILRNNNKLEASVRNDSAPRVSVLRHVQAHDGVPSSVRDSSQPLGQPHEVSRPARPP